jgi:hypothetical protein
MQQDTRAQPYRLAYDEAVRTLSEQRQYLDNLGTRAGILLSAAAIATSFLGGQSLRTGGPTGTSWVAIALFFLLGVVVVLILWPRTGWEFAATPRRLVATYIETEEPLDISGIYRDLSFHMEDSYVKNQDRIDRLIVYLRVASGLLTLEIVTWIVDLATT